MSEGDWCDPPASNRGKWQRFVDELQTRPGEWRCAVDNATLARGSTPAVRLRKFGAEVTTRQVSTKDGTFISVWARWPA